MKSDVWKTMFASGDNTIARCAQPEEGSHDPGDRVTKQLLSETPKTRGTREALTGTSKTARSVRSHVTVLRFIDESLSSRYSFESACRFTARTFTFTKHSPR